MGNWLSKWKIRGSHLGINKWPYCDWKIAQKLDTPSFMPSGVENEN